MNTGEVDVRSALVTRDVSLQLEGSESHPTTDVI